MRCSLGLSCHVALTMMFFLAVGTSCFASDTIPPNMAASRFQIRPGVFDYGDTTTVGDVFLEQHFSQATGSDGKVTSSRYGKSEVSGTTLALEIDVYQGLERQMSLTFVMTVSHGVALLESVRLRNFATGVDLESSEVEDKVAVIGIFQSLQSQSR